jgi:hypothetical protein
MQGNAGIRNRLYKDIAKEANAAVVSDRKRAFGS